MNHAHALNFSFVIPGKLAAMSYPGRIQPLEEALDFLQEQNIQGIVSLTEDPLSQQKLQKYPFRYLHLPIADFHSPTLEQIQEMVQFIDEINAQGGATVIHCLAGYGRTGTMLACYLVKTGLSAHQSIQRVRELRPGSIETPLQEDVVWTYASLLRG